MKTDKSKTKVEVAVFKDMNSNTTIKTGKKLAPVIKTEAFGDKENVKKSQLLQASDVKSKVIESIDTSKDTKRKVHEADEVSNEKILKKITAEDLTSEAGPSEVYWEVLAERRRKALEEALGENSFLHEKVELLQKENETLKQALADATDVIEVLNEIVGESENAPEQSSQVDSSDEDNRRSENELQRSPIKSAFGDESTILNDSDDSVRE